jgi:hypothetical protein
MALLSDAGRPLHCEAIVQLLADVVLHACVFKLHPAVSSAPARVREGHPPGVLYASTVHAAIYTQWLFVQFQVVVPQPGVQYVL